MPLQLAPKAYAWPLALILGAVLSACGGPDNATPTVPSVPSRPSAPVPPIPSPRGPGSGTIAIRQLSPAPGAILTVRSDCSPGYPGDLLRMCTDTWQGTLDVTVDREMTNAVLTVRFYDGHTKCGYGAGTLDIVPAGRRVSFSVYRIVVKDEWLAQPCQLPFTTNRIEAELWSDLSTWTNTLIQVFEGGYTFSSPDLFREGV